MDAGDDAGEVEGGGMKDGQHIGHTALSYGWLVGLIFDGDRVPFGQSWEWYERMKREWEDREEKCR
jgi:hypothetical protein